MNFNWEKGSYLTEPEITADCSALVAGDWLPLWNFEALVLEQPLAIYGDLLPDLQASNCNIVNLECPLSNKGKPILKVGPNLRADPATIKSLQDANFNIACLANNHIFDYGIDAFQQTTEVLTNGNIQYVGAGTTPAQAYEPLIVKIKNVQIGIINFCEGEDETSVKNNFGTFGWERERIINTIESLKNKVDVIIVIFHGGYEYIPVPPPYIVETHRLIAEAGANIIIGHHPHVPQGIEIYKNVPIIYSEGNFVLYNGSNCIYQRTGFLTKLLFSQKKFIGFKIIPYFINPTGLSLMTNVQQQWFFQRLKTASEPFNKKSLIQTSWNAVIDNDGVPNIIPGFKHNAFQLTQNPVTAAVQLRNRLTTPAHKNLLYDTIIHIMHNKKPEYSEHTKNLLDEWRTHTIKNSTSFFTKIIIPFIKDFIAILAEAPAKYFIIMVIGWHLPLLSFLVAQKTNYKILLIYFGISFFLTILISFISGKLISTFKLWKNQTHWKKYFIINATYTFIIILSFVITKFICFISKTQLNDIVDLLFWSFCFPSMIIYSFFGIILTIIFQSKKYKKYLLYILTQ